MSFSQHRSSFTMKIKSKRLRMVVCKSMFSAAVFMSSYRPEGGLAAAITAARELSTVVIPALAMEMVCCSIASWMATRSSARILSNSSMHTTPPSASTMAPACNVFSLVPGSRMMEAVSPAAEDPFPEVYTAMGAVLCTNFRSWDLAVDGSPSSSTLTSPRRRTPSGRILRAPPKSRQATAALTSSTPKMAGAILFRSSWMTLGCAANCLNSASSAAENMDLPRALPSRLSSSPTARMYGCWMATPARTSPRVLAGLVTAKMPTMVTRVPGTMRCTSERSTTSCMFLGSSPTGTSSGFSCSLRRCMSMYLDRSGSTVNGSSGHASSPALASAARALQVRGIMAPPNPGLHVTTRVFLQVRHCRVMCVALDTVSLAWMTMPESTTSLETSLDESWRMVLGSSVLCSNTWMACAAGEAPSSSSIFCVRSDCTSSLAANSSRGRYSPGLLRNASASARS
mmetsp:Transcript_41672/g.79645  ORF Transcript_41672/g.79645 Transcript_41672/m.79645 type:complete len:456 (+) Transcript_41672:753-2120(+)